MSLFDQLLDSDPESASPEARVELLVVLQQLERWAQAMQQRVLAAVAVDPDGVGVSDAARAVDPAGVVADKHYEYDALALALRVSHEVMPQRMFDAVTLVQKLPASLNALQDGLIGLPCRGPGSKPPRSSSKRSAAPCSPSKSPPTKKPAPPRRWPSGGCAGARVSSG